MLKLYSHAIGQRTRRFPWQALDTRVAEGRFRTSSEPKLELPGFDFGDKVADLTSRPKGRRDSFTHRRCSPRIAWFPS
ncbi:hypothetical protein BCR43DRAFT_496147, partial [Syncephalastrum racemosum]